MKRIIEDFIERNNEIADFIGTAVLQYKDGVDILPFISEKVIQSEYNIALGNYFSELLQLSDNENINIGFEVGDIGRRYSSLLRVQEYNLENYIESAHFEYSILDNTEKAKQIAIAGIEIAKRKTEELQRLLETISNAE